jgi:hypothetical protein
MKLITFIQNDQFRLGVKTEQGIIDVAGALALVPSESSIPTTIHEVIDGGTTAVGALQNACFGFIR